MERFYLAVVAANLVILTLGASPCASQKEGFQSFNCGGRSLIDEKSKIEWMEDPYMSQNNESLYGNASKVDSGFDNVPTVMTTLRYFPNESRNRKFCYYFPVSNGNTYLVRASFLYGNYDKLKKPPTFLLIINYDIWTSVTTSLSLSPIMEELIFVSKNNDLNICLANDRNTNHTLFISTLELRPLDARMYSESIFQPPLTTGILQSYGLRLWQRVNYGAKTETITRYPDDPYDRIWEANTTGPTVSTNTSNVGSNYVTDASKPPAEVRATAITVQDPKANLSFTYEGLGSGIRNVRMELHFQETDESLISQPQLPRAFGIAFPNSSDVLVQEAQEISSIMPIVPGQSAPLAVVVDQAIPLPLRITLYPLSISSHKFGPLLNAIELFYWTDQILSSTGTFPDDEYAITLIQRHFNLFGYGQGDPCMPKGYEWTWIKCNNDSPPKIIEINLANLNLTGDIPLSINSLSSLQRIDLSHNLLNGSIPVISNLHNLNYLDISYNNFCGRSPYFQPHITYNDTGNKRLCKNATCDCISTIISNFSMTTNLPTKKQKRKYIVSIFSLGALYIISILAFLFICIYKARQKIKRKHTKSTSIEFLGQKGNVDLQGLSSISKMFTYKEISDATLSFTKILGEGGFGKVYHGLLPTGEEIAVKMLVDASKQGLKEFFNEVAILSKLRHKNLVSLIGCCVENTCMLIYEYIAKGNIRDLLYGDLESTDKPLSWATRLNIALDASQGLDYLHTGCDPTIIHRDVKSTNILLSEKMQAKVADFGLSRLKEGDNTTSHVSTINVMGTVGYLDPAYNATNQLTDKSDVYSFGIVLLELICGRAPIDMFKTPPHIAEWASGLVAQGKVVDIVDPMLPDGYKMESLQMVVDVALQCVDNDRSKRPKMSKVSQLLQIALEVEMDPNFSSKDFSGSSLE